jgi:hypothetical protein
MALRKAITYAEQAPQLLKLLNHEKMAQKIVLNAVSWRLKECKKHVNYGIQLKMRILPIL